MTCSRALARCSLALLLSIAFVPTSSAGPCVHYEGGNDALASRPPPAFEIVYLAPSFGTYYFHRDLVVVGGHAYLSSNVSTVEGGGDDGVVLVAELPSSGAPMKVGEVDTGELTAQALVAKGSRLFVAADWSIQLYDLTQPASPAWITSTPAGTAVKGLRVEGELLLAASGIRGLKIYQTGGDQIQHLATHDTPGQAIDVAVDGDVAVVADTWSLQLVDISDPAQPGPWGDLVISNHNFYRVVTSDDFAYVTSLAYVSDGTDPKLLVVDISQPMTPAVVEELSLTDLPEDLLLLGDLLYVSTPEPGLMIYDVREPSQPEVVANPSLPGYEPRRLAVDAEYETLLAIDLTSLLRGELQCPPVVVSVLVSGLQAETRGSEIVLRWRTSDPDAHFHLDRSRAGGRENVRLTQTPLRGGPEFEFIDSGAIAESRYSYALVQLLPDGDERVLDEVELRSGSSRFSMRAPVPNPFVEDTQLAFELPLASHVRLGLYDVAGRHVRTLLNGVVRAGPHRVAWDGRDADGAVVAAGIYFARLSTESSQGQQRIVRLR